MNRPFTPKGSRAPFGVILITTKKGVSGQTNINYNNNFRWGAPVILPNMVDSYTFSTFMNDAADMTKEGRNDWGAYSAGQLIDPTLYNIRRERRCELLGEGLRWMDLQRWRSCDQMIETPYHIEGFKLWGPMKEWYLNADGSSALTYGLDLPGALVSPPESSIYLRPYEKSRTSLVLNGYRWHVAHYLSPIAIWDFQITSRNNDLSTSPIYQNPGWPLVAGQSPE